MAKVFIWYTVKFMHHSMYIKFVMLSCSRGKLLYGNNISLRVEDHFCLYSQQNFHEKVVVNAFEINIGSDLFSVDLK